jgi:murein DD-endopeptidase MepM/ murein hydrolase activator NlpD
MRLPPRSSIAFWGLLACLAAITLARVDLRSRPSMATANADPVEDAGAVIVPLAESPPGIVEVADVPPPEPEPSPSIRYHIADTLGRDGSIYLTLKSHDVAELEIAQLGQALADVFDAKRDTRPGDVVTMVLDSARSVIRFEYTPAREPERPVLLVREGGSFQASRRVIELSKRVWAIEVTIEDNLSNAIAAAGEGDALTDFVVDYVFGSVIDFHREPRKGDRLGLVFERLYMGDRFIRYGNVLLARYEGKVAEELGVYYEDPMGQSQYYDAEGQSLERMFMLKPMQFRRISSRFNRKRFHPVLKRNLPHLGTDYAAAPGTDIWATAKGHVTVAGWNGSYGKMVEVEHPNGYRTRYAHLSRILVRKGQRVDKRKLVGQVGSTGRATGPHLHYELIHNDKQIDPATVNRGDDAPILAAAYRDAFEHNKRYFTRLLDDSRRAPPAAIADAAHRRPAALTTP